MKRWTAALLLCVCLMGIMAPALAANPSFQEITGLNQIQRKLNSGKKITGIHYESGGNGYNRTFSLDEWDTANIKKVWNAIRKIRIQGVGSGWVTDMYPSIEFYVSDGTTFRISFLNHMYSYNGVKYQLKDDSLFWQVVSEMESSPFVCVFPVR